MARIVCGPNELDNPRYDGKTIQDVKAELREVLNIPEGATVLLNGAASPGCATPLREGDELEFVKPAGEKGAL